MAETRRVNVGNIVIANDAPLVIISGPCAIESRDHALATAERLASICGNLGLDFIYKSSFDKANRTSVSSERGPGMDEGLEVLRAVKETIGCPVLTDVHLPGQCAAVAEVADVLQIPAFLCRQTDLLLAAAETGRAVNVKKGQFLAPWDMARVVEKVSSTGNGNILQCERGTSFGYNMLISDMRGLVIMAENGYPVVFDATHSVQLPGGQGGTSGGQRQYVAALARAAVATGIAALFVESHEDPDRAPSDGPNMVPLDAMPSLLKTLKSFDAVAKTPA